MECLSPILSNTVKHGRIWLPCSKCIACKQRAGREWFIRMKKHYEAQKQPSYFITLTYADEHMKYSPETGEAIFEKERVQQFIMSLRNVCSRGLPRELQSPKHKTFDTGGKLSYFAIAERGELFGRNHYHIMAFNVPYDHYTLTNICQYYWPEGRIDVGKCEDASICYITDYMVTKQDETTEWRIMSKGIGSEYIAKHGKMLRQRMDFKVPVHDKSFNMPRYYRKKVFSDMERRVIGKKITKELQDQQTDNYHVELQERINALQAKLDYKRQKRQQHRIDKLKNRS